MDISCLLEKACFIPISGIHMYTYLKTHLIRAMSSVFDGFWGSKHPKEVFFLQDFTIKAQRGPA